jgi:hypothetical protein
VSSDELLKCLVKKLSPSPLNFDELKTLFVYRSDHKGIKCTELPLFTSTSNPNKILFGEKGIGKTTFLRNNINNLENSGFVAVSITFNPKSFSSEFLIREILIQLINKYLNLKKPGKEISYYGIPLSGVRAILVGESYTKKEESTEDINAHLGIKGNAGVISGEVGVGADKSKTKGTESFIRKLPMEKMEELLSFVIGIMSRGYSLNLLLTIDDISYYSGVDSKYIKYLGEELYKFDRIVGDKLSQYALKNYEYFGIFVLDTKIWDILRRKLGFIFYFESDVAEEFIDDPMDEALKNMSDETLKSILNKRINDCVEGSSLTDVFQDEKSFDNLIRLSKSNPRRMIVLLKKAINSTLKNKKNRVVI